MRRIAFVAVSLMLTLGAAFAQAPDAAPPAPDAPPPADAAPPPPANPVMTGPQVLIQTTMGDIVLQLDSVRAPQSVAHILRQVRSGFYNNSIIYRVEKDFVIQMGSWDAKGQGRGWYARPVPLEANNGLRNYKYAVALPRGDDPNGAGPDFYINMRDNLALDRKPDDTANKTGFAVFGEVAEASRPVLQAINEVPVGGGKGPFAASEPQTPIVITKVSVVGDPPPRPTAKPAAAKPTTAKKTR